VPANEPPVEIFSAFKRAHDIEGEERECER